MQKRPSINVLIVNFQTEVAKATDLKSSVKISVENFLSNLGSVVKVLCCLLNFFS